MEMPMTLERRCEFTKNLCGTDTWGSLTPCKCRQCQAWLMEYCIELEQDRAGANANSRDQIFRIRSLEVKLLHMVEAAKEVIRISDRKHEAWDRLKEVLKQCT